MTKFKVALIGYGYWGEKIARVISENPKLELTDIVDTDKSRLELAQTLNPKSRTHLQWEAFHEVDAVAVFTPLGQHDDLLLYALKAQKPCLVAKPLSLEDETFAACLAATKGEPYRLMVDQTFVFSPAIQTLKQVFANKSLGALKSIQGFRLNTSHKASDYDIHWDLLGHDLSILWSLKDFDWQNVKVLEADFNHAQVCQDLAISMESSCGVPCRLHISGASQQKVRRMEFEFERGQVVYDEGALSKVRLISPHGASLSLPVENTEPLKTLIATWGDSLDHKRPTDSGLELAVKIHKVLKPVCETLPDRARNWS